MNLNEKTESGMMPPKSDAECSERELELLFMLNEMNAKYRALEKKNELLQQRYDDISNATWWKITKPLRGVTEAVERVWDLKESVQKYGIRNVIKKIWKRIKKTLGIQTPVYTKADLRFQRQTVFPQKVKISILVPLYNTPKKFLREMIQSVLDQTYANWELCLADGSSEEHPEVEKICRKYCNHDSRIVYRKLEKNLGISGNTNACIDMSTGDYIALFDHDDLLHPAALYEVMKAITEQGADFIYTDENTFHNKPSDAFQPHYKPDFAPDTLRANNYICHLSVFSRELLDKVGHFNSSFDGSQDYDLILRLTEQAKKIVHIPKVLYYWRAHANSTAQDISSKPYVIDSAKRAIAEHLKRVGLDGTVSESLAPTTYRVRYQIHGTPKVSIVIPNMDHVATLQACIDSILQVTTYSNFEIIIIENNSKKQETFDYYNSLKSNSHIKIVVWDGIFNYSAINNFGIREAASGDYYLLLNNDITVITPDWIQEMLMFVQRDDVGAAGAMLYYPGDTIQHAGVIVGLGGVAGHAHQNLSRGQYGYFDRACLVQNLSAVTAACMMIRKDVWEKVNGLDEAFQVAFNDIDLCMRIRQAGYLIVWTPYAELYHYESKSRGYEDTPEKQQRFQGEIDRFQKRWHAELTAGDPYYNPNFDLYTESFYLGE